MENAYDRIEWDFLWATLSAFEFPLPWIQWVKECVTNISYSTKISGKPMAWFKPSCGLR